MPDDAASKPGAGRARRPRRVFLGPVEVAGYYRNLKAGLAELGVDATVVDLTDHPFRYGGAPQRGLAALAARALRTRLAVPPGARARRLGWLAVEASLRALLFAWAAARFDAFVFSFGTTILGLPAVELPLLRRLGKTIVSVHHGSDSRPPYLDGSLMAGDRGRTAEDCVRLARVTKSRVARLDRYAHWVVDNPLSSQFHERPCVNWFAIGVPYVGAPEAGPSAGRDGGAAVRVLHSPSHPEAKGSDRIGDVVARLIAKGHAIDFVQITGRPHADVARELAACDFVIDQLYSDTPMAGLATEATHFGKPSVVAGYGAPAFGRFIPDEMMPPTAYCHPDDVEATVERLVVDAEFRRALGRRAEEFVRTRWSLPSVARAYLRLFEHAAPADWLFDPREVEYVHGGALTEARARTLVANVIAAGGPASLLVADKPALERRLVEFARGYVAGGVAHPEGEVTQEVTA
jgi:hypothetical protein